MVRQWSHLWNIHAAAHCQFRCWNCDDVKRQVFSSLSFQARVAAVEVGRHVPSGQLSTAVNLHESTRYRGVSYEQPSMPLTPISTNFTPLVHDHVTSSGSTRSHGPWRSSDSRRPVAGPPRVNGVDSSGPRWHASKQWNRRIRARRRRRRCFVNCLRITFAPDNGQRYRTTRQRPVVASVAACRSEPAHTQLQRCLAPVQTSYQLRLW